MLCLDGHRQSSLAEGNCSNASAASGALGTDVEPQHCVVRHDIVRRTPFDLCAGLTGACRAFWIAFNRTAKRQRCSCDNAHCGHLPDCDQRGRTFSGDR